MSNPHESRMEPHSTLLVLITAAVRVKLRQRPTSRRRCACALPRRVACRSRQRLVLAAARTTDSPSSSRVCAAPRPMTGRVKAGKPEPARVRSSTDAALSRSSPRFNVLTERAAVVRRGPASARHYSCLAHQQTGQVSYSSANRHSDWSDLNTPNRFK